MWKADFDSYGWFGKLTVPSNNSNLMWEYKPYGRYEYIRTNRYGFRDYDYVSKDKPNDVYRIAFVGDSVTLGFTVRADDTFVNKFGVFTRELAPRAPIEGMNFEIDGFNTPQIYELIVSRVVAFSSDEIVYVMCLNDFDFKAASAKKIRYF